MYNSYIKRKLGHVVNTFSTRYAFIQHVPGHMDSQGESAPYVIKSHKNNKILSSHKTREDAKKHLIDMKIHASYNTVFLPEKTKEIIVHMRMQKGLDKQQLMDYVIKKFNLIEQDAERLFYDAFPDGLDLQEEKSLNILEDVIQGAGGIPVEFLENVFNSYLSECSPDAGFKSINPVVKDNIKIVISSLLRRRGFI